jgi:hypothetical protein
MTIQRWRSRGLLAAPDRSLPWQQDFCILPTPYFTEEGTLRVYFASTDADLVGRIGFIEVQPSESYGILTRARHPVLQAGEPGAFDDCGVNPSCVIHWDGATWMFYVGYQRTEKLPYLLFAGLAVSEDDGLSFRRFSQVPILERIDGERTIRSAPSVLRIGDGLRMWYVSGDSWMPGPKGDPVPTYGIRTLASHNVRTWTGPGDLCLSPRAEVGEVGFGRPWVLFYGGMFHIWFSVRSIDDEGRLAYRSFGYAESHDGIVWTRQEQAVALTPSGEEWDSEAACYPAVIRHGAQTFLFYNGNRNGRTGFGVAELER